MTGVGAGERRLRAGVFDCLEQGIAILETVVENAPGVSGPQIDLGIALILANEDLVGVDDESLVFTIGKTFDLD